MRAASAVALATLALLGTGCAETPEQREARLAVERVAGAGETRCTSNPGLFFREGPTASVFVCIVRSGGALCDRYVVRRRGRRYTVRLQARDADCILPAP